MPAQPTSGPNGLSQNLRDLIDEIGRDLRRRPRRKAALMVRQRRSRTGDGTIKTDYVFPVPVRQLYGPCFDWQAYRDPEGPIGRGATEQAAVDDLLAQEGRPELFP